MNGFRRSSAMISACNQFFLRPLQSLVLRDGLKGVFFWAALSGVSFPALGQVSESPTPLPSAAAPLTEAGKKALLSNYKAALAVEARALLHRQRFELLELRASQNAQRKDFQAREKEARKQAFKESTSGAEKRRWMEARELRWKALQKLQGEELEKRKQEQKARRESLKVEQQERLKRFEEALSQGVRPQENLWPQAH
jgi:hypothetical protein